MDLYFRGASLDDTNMSLVLEGAGSFISISIQQIHFELWERPTRRSELYVQHEGIVLMLSDLMSKIVRLDVLKVYLDVVYDSHCFQTMRSGAGVPQDDKHYEQMLDH